MAVILVAEDEVANQHLIQRMLLLGGHTSLLARNGKEAITMAEDHHPDLILMDMSMPSMDGYEATNILKHHPQLSGIPIVALTAHAMRGDRERSLRAGCDAYLSKPFDYYDLMDLIQQLVKA